MNRESLLAGLLEGECVDPRGVVQLLIELAGPNELGCHALQEVLQELPCQLAWQEKAPGFRLYVLADLGADHDQLLGTVAAFLDDRPQGLQLVETRLVQRSAGAPARHGFRFVTRGPAGPRDIVLAAGSHAFGSGNHPSTSLVVELLEEMAALPAAVLDVGCGTGVLALVAARLGAGQVVGLDIDEEAVQVAADNARANGLEGRLSFTSAPLQEIAGPFGLILANLTGSVLFRLLGGMTSLAGPGCRLILSGLQGRQGDEALQWAAELGWRQQQRRNLGKWQALLLVRE